MDNDRTRAGSPIIVLAFLGVAAALSLAVGTRALDLHFLLGPWFSHHWIAWIGAAFIAVFTPVFYLVRKKDRSKDRAVLPVHVFGGLAAITLIAMHATQHLTRPAEFYPDLGTGVVLVAALVVAAATGVLMYYRIAKGAMREWRLLHVAAAGAFYLTIVMHALEGLGVV